MAQLMVLIDIDNVSYDVLRKEVIDSPNPDWFENGDPSTHRVSVDEAYLKVDPRDNSFFTFKLIGVRP